MYCIWLERIEPVLSLLLYVCSIMIYVCVYRNFLNNHVILFQLIFILFSKLVVISRKVTLLHFVYLL